MTILSNWTKLAAVLSSEGIDMKRGVPGILFASALTLFAGTADAITNGQPDNGQHPYVGVIVFDTLVDGQPVPTTACSGSLLSPTVVLTAGHCTDGAVAARVWFTSGIDEVPDFPTGGQVAIEGTPHTHPDFCIGCGGGLVGFATHDVGVVVIDDDTPVILPEYAELPLPGIVDTLPMHTELTAVGYGVQSLPKGPPPHEWIDFGTRLFANTLLIASNNRISDEFLKFTLNPAQGKGGACFGDSGGPILRDDSNIVLAVASFGTNYNCAGVGYATRIDTPDILSFVQGYL